MTASAPQYSRPRKSARYLLDCRAVVVPDSDPSARVQVNTTDISEGGMSVISPATLQPDAAVTVEFVFPITAEFFRAGAWIRNRSGFRYGLEFVSVAPAQARMIRRFGHETGVVG